MLLLRWVYFARPVPDAEVVSLALEDWLLEDELEDDFALGRQPVEDDYQPILLFEETGEDEDPQPLESIPLPEADDFIAIFRLEEEAEEDPDPQLVEWISLPEGDDFIAIFRLEDEAEDEADGDDFIVINLDFGPAVIIPDIFPFVEIDDNDTEEFNELDELFSNFDFGNPVLPPDIIAAFFDADGDNDIEEFNQLDELFTNFDFNAIPLVPLGKKGFRNVDIWPPISASYYRYRPLGQTSITATGGVQTLGTIPPDAVMAIILVSGTGGDIRFTDDGQTPSSSFGLRRYSGQQFAYSGNLSAFRFKAISGASILKIAFYK